MANVAQERIPHTPEVAHEVRLLRQAYARRYASRTISGPDMLLDFGSPDPGFIWLVERIAIHASAAPTAIDFYTGEIDASAYVGSAPVAALTSAQFDPPLHVPQRVPLRGKLAGFVASVHATAQLVICRTELTRVELPPKDIHAVLCKILDAVSFHEIEE